MYIRDVTFINCANPLDSLLQSLSKFSFIILLMSILYRLNK